MGIPELRDLGAKGMAANDGATGKQAGIREAQIYLRATGLKDTTE